MFTLNSNEPTKVAQLQKLANQSMLNNAPVMATKTSVVLQSKERSNRKEICDKLIV